MLQGDELQLLAGLASDAAGLLWELAAMHDTGEAATDMLAKSEQLQVDNGLQRWQDVSAWMCSFRAVHVLHHKWQSAVYHVVQHSCRLKPCAPSTNL